MKLVLSLLIIAATSSLALVQKQELSPDVGLKIADFAKLHGYPLESYEVQTEDGFILTLNRIPAGQNQTEVVANKPVVFLMHGILSNAIDWINMGPEKSLGLRLADAGFDVWLGNQRGNTWSKKHLTLDPVQNASQFFDYSFHDIAVYDLPANIDFILEKTGQKNLSYVGHSQGTTVGFALTAFKPEYNDKINIIEALAPVAYMANFPSPYLRYFVDNYVLLNLILATANIYELLPYYDFYIPIAEAVCLDGSEYQELCVLILGAICGFDTQIDPNFLPVALSNMPAGASVKQLAHYAQGAKSEEFALYDYGFIGNLERYGQTKPPSYNISQIKAPVSLHYGANDFFTAPIDVEQLASELPNLYGLHLVPYDKFNHLDFMWARNVDLVNDIVMEELKLVNWLNGTN